ncbi:hypothetical protein ACJJTC_016768 [Scirpophaga incertulas]
MAEPKLDKLIKKRSCIKSKLTIFSNYLALLKSSHSLSSVQLLDLESRFNKFNSLYATFDELQCDIEMLSDSIDNECIEREHFENQYHTLTAEARSLLGEQPAQRRELRDSSVTINCRFACVAVHSAREGAGLQWRRARRPSAARQWQYG